MQTYRQSWKTVAFNTTIIASLIFGFIFTHTAHTLRAVTFEGLSNNIELWDSNNNGKIDQVTFSITNLDLDNWSLTGAACTGSGGCHGLQTFQDGSEVDIDDVSFTTATNAAYVGVLIELDETDSDLDVDTSEDAIELVYTQSTWATCSGGASCVIDNLSTELNAIASGDTGGTDTEIDAAAPVMTAAAIAPFSANYGGHILDFNGITFDYSEPLFVSTDGGSDADLLNGDTTMSTSTLGSMFFLRQIGGIATFDVTNGGNMKTSDPAGNLVYLQNSGTRIRILFNYDDYAYFIGSIPPSSATVTPISDANDITDEEGYPVNPLATVTMTGMGWDVTPPVVTHTYSCDTDEDGDIDRIQVTVNENIMDPYIDVADFEGDNDNINNGTGEETPVSYNTETGGCDGNPNDADAFDDQFRFDFTNGIDGTEAAYLHMVNQGLKDTAGNLAQTAAGAGTEHDKAIPLILTGDGTSSEEMKYSDDDRNGKVDKLFMYFSETVTGSSVLSLNDIIVTDDGDFTGLAAGTNTTDLITSNRASITIYMGIESSAYDTYDDSDSLTIQMQNAFALVDAAGNSNTTTGVDIPVKHDIAHPSVYDIMYEDTNENGKIDQLTLSFTERLSPDSSLDRYDLHIDDPGDFTGIEIGYSSDDDLITSPIDQLVLPLDTPASVADTRDDSGLLSVVVSGSIFSLKGSESTFSNANFISDEVTYTDGARPVVRYTTPYDGGTMRPLDEDFVVKFSESMDTSYLNDENMEYWFNPAIGGLSESFSEDDSLMTIAHDAFDEDQSASFHILGGFAESDNGEVLCSYPGDCNSDFVVYFTAKEQTSGGGGGGGGGGAAPVASTTPEISITSPDTGDDFPAESFFDITYDISGSGINSVELRFSENGGLTRELIATNLDPSDGSYNWQVPADLSGDVILYAYAHDSGKAVLDTDNVMISVTPMGSEEGEETPTEEPVGEDEEETVEEDAARAERNAYDEENGIVRDSQDRRIAPASDSYGSSPYDGEEEVISVVRPGWFIRSLNYNTIYFVTEDLERKPFWDAMTYFTWADSWDETIWVTDATLATMELASPMLPKPGVVLIKISSDPKVYWTEYSLDDPDTYILRWITDETVASGTFGANWADYIIDVAPTIITHYTHGSDMSSIETVDIPQMKTRAELTASIASSK